MRPLRRLLPPVLFAALCAWPAAADDQVAEAGKKLYLRYCASCHGPSAKGDGMVGEALKTPPPDLTRIAARRSGSFPEAELGEFIDGRKDVKAHGTRDMPVWGVWLAGEEGEKLREKQREALTSTRIRILLAYLKSIQAP